MRRKTNLFYTDGPDSKFLTFSNYTELLTGNFLSTDTKIYPSRFLCLSIPSLNINNKTEFIETYLIGYYENKLAFLRDYCVENDNKPEEYLSPLSYLLDTISKYCKDKNFNYDITYFGDISEQDYNGTYTDTICIVDFAKYYKATIGSSSDQHENAITSIEYKYKDENEIIPGLYGWVNKNTETQTWENKLNGTQFGNLNPMFDDGEYLINSYNTLNLVNVNMNPNVSEEKNTIKFNIIIPLFDVTNINYKTYEEDIVNDSDFEIDLYQSYNKYVPLGIWFADKEIILEKDINTGYSQTWSLLISSQFKPFPYTHEDVNVTDNLNNAISFPTFAMVLAQQNEMIEAFNKTNQIIGEYHQKLNSMQSTINNLSSINVDKLQKKIIDIETQFNQLKNDVYKTLQEIKSSKENN